MRYFDTAKMGPIRAELEREILNWAGVSSREMMGCLCYFHGKKMLAFLVTNGIVISKLSDEQEKELSKLSKRIAFKMAGKAIRKPVWALRTSGDLRTILPFLKKGYEASFEERK